MCPFPLSFFGSWTPSRSRSEWCPNGLHLLLFSPRRTAGRSPSLSFRTRLSFKFFPVFADTPTMISWTSLNPCDLFPRCRIAGFVLRGQSPRTGWFSSLFRPLNQRSYQKRAILSSAGSRALLPSPPQVAPSVPF